MTAASNVTQHSLNCTRYSTQLVQCEWSVRLVVGGVSGKLRLSRCAPSRRRGEYDTRQVQEMRSVDRRVARPIVFELPLDIKFQSMD